MQRLLTRRDDDLQQNPRASIAATQNKEGAIQFVDARPYPSSAKLSVACKFSPSIRKTHRHMYKYEQHEDDGVAHTMPIASLAWGSLWSALPGLCGGTVHQHSTVFFDQPDPDENLILIPYLQQQYNMTTGQVSFMRVGPLCREDCLRVAWQE